MRRRDRRNESESESETGEKIDVCLPSLTFDTYKHLDILSSIGRLMFVYGWCLYFLLSLARDLRAAPSLTWLYRRSRRYIINRYSLSSSLSVSLSLPLSEELPLGERISAEKTTRARRDSIRRKSSSAPFSLLIESTLSIERQIQLVQCQ